MPAESPSLWGVLHKSFGGVRAGKTRSPGGKPSTQLGAAKSVLRPRLRGENASAEELRFPRVRLAVSSMRIRRATPSRV